MGLVLPDPGAWRRKEDVVRRILEPDVRVLAADTGRAPKTDNKAVQARRETRTAA